MEDIAHKLRIQIKNQNYSTTSVKDLIQQHQANKHNKMKIFLAFGLLASILSTTNAVKDAARNDGEVR